ncbi:MAG: hypothetical protein JST87_08355 [Bacteroidetes bacterium]|nr:hypothetical protein [Bacteroidota bacterium]
MKRIFFLIFFSTALYNANVYAQTDSAFALSKTIEGDIADFTVDNVGNIYLLSKTNQLKKVSANGDSLGVYNAVTRFGDISFIDVTNPLKILIYYKDFATIVETDRFLNILNTIDLRKLGIFQVKAIGLAYDNNIWFFDELDAQLKRVADDGTLVSQTTDFRQLFDFVPDPSVIIDQNELVYLYDSTRGVYAFDHYGTLKSHVQLKDWQDFTVIDKSLIGRNDKFFLKYQLGKLDIQQEALPDAYLNAQKIKVTSPAIYVLKKNVLQVYARR